MNSSVQRLESFLRTDPQWMALPHPKLAQVMGVKPYLAEVMGSAGIKVLESVLQDLTQTKGQLIRKAAQVFPGLRKLTALGDQPGILDMAALEGFLAPLRFGVNDGHIFEVEQELDQLLALTDIGSSAPIEFFRSPYRASYFQFAAHGGGIEFDSPHSGRIPLMGAYLTELHTNTACSEEASLFEKWAGAAGELLCFEITQVTCPVKVVSAHRFFFTRIYVGPRMAGMTVSDVLDLNWTVQGNAGLHASDAEERTQQRAGIEHLTKALLQIHAEGTELVHCKEASELAQRLREVGAKKASKLNRRLERAVDRIVIRHVQRPPTTAAPPTQLPAGVRQHWRRGHFRWQAHGPARRLHKLKWIAPMLIGELQSGDAASREYVVRS